MSLPFAQFPPTMNTQLLRYLLPASLAVATLGFAQEKKQIIVRQVDGAAPQVTVKSGEPGEKQIRVRVGSASAAGPSGEAFHWVGDGAEKEKAAFLGVETAPVGPTLATQLGLKPGMGLVITRISKDTPAAAVLQEHDVLTKFEDQWLVDSRQFSVLVRSRQPGDEVTLTLVRAGKETKAKARLIERELPKLGLGEGPGRGFNFLFSDDAAVAGLGRLHGLGREELDDVVKVIGRERGNWTGAPRVHVMRRGGAGGATVLNLPAGNMVFNDDAGSLEINAVDGKRELTVKDAAGKLTFQGPITTDEDRAKLPPEVKARLDQFQQIDVEVRTDDTFEQKVDVLGGPAKTRQLLRPRHAPPAPRTPSL